MDGALLMKRAFTPGHDDNNFVHATMLGFIAAPSRNAVRAVC